MDATTLIVLIVCVAVVVLVLAGALMWQRTRSKGLREQFGSEYDRTLRHTRDKNRGERELDNRRRRVKSLDIRPLRPDQADRYREAWLGVQARFIDDPQSSVDDADRLINDVMLARGYPEEDFERRVADISVQHPETVSGYRKAHGIRGAHGAGASPELEQMRQALLDYRRLFMELLEDTPQRRAG